MSVRTQDSEGIVVALTPNTQVDEVEGMFHLRKKQLGLTALIPGLPVQVKGSLNDRNQVVADTVNFQASDLKTAQDIQTGLVPTQQQVQANQATILADDQQIEANPQRIEGNQREAAANQAAIVAASKRFGELREYNILGEVTVYFANGKVDLEP